jgi:ABC-type nitrate/sulfonate/bicarbonate transport system substrate-binding protein
MSVQATRRQFITRGTCGALSLAAFGSGMLGPQSMRRAAAAEAIGFGYLPVNVDLPVFTGVVNPWRDGGLDVRFIRAEGGPAILQALASGDIPVGDIGTAPAIITATRGFPFYFLTLMSVATPERPLDRIMVLQDSPIKKFQDLKGRTLAINQFGTMPDAALGAAARVYGLPRSEINIVPVPYPNMPQVLAQKQVDAIYAFPPADTVAEVRYGARTIAETADFIPYLGFTTLAVRRDFATQNPEAVRRLVQGAIKTQRWINDHQGDARNASNRFLDIPGDIGPKVRLPYFTADGLTVMANVWHLYYLLVSGGVIKAVDDPEKLFSDYFVEPTKRFTLPAVQELGLEPDPVVSKMLKASYPLLPKPVEAYHAPWDSAFL